MCGYTQYHTENDCEGWLRQIHNHFYMKTLIKVYVWRVSSCIHVTWLNYIKNKPGLTGHPHHSLSHCQASPSLLLSPSLEVAHQRRGEAGKGDLSLQWEVPLQALVTALPPPDTLRKNKRRDTCSRQSKQYMYFITVLTNGMDTCVHYLSSDWLLGGGWLGAGPLPAEKKHLIGWVPEKGPMNARGRLELTGALRWSTLQRKRALFTTNSWHIWCP